MRARLEMRSGERNTDCAQVTFSRLKRNPIAARALSYHMIYHEVHKCGADKSDVGLGRPTGAGRKRFAPETEQRAVIN